MANMETCLAVARGRGRRISQKICDLSCNAKDDNDPWDIPSAVCWGKYDGKRWILCRVSFEHLDKTRSTFSAKAEAEVIALAELAKDEFWASDPRLYSVFSNARTEAAMTRFLTLLETDVVEHNGIRIALAWHKPETDEGR